MLLLQSVTNWFEKVILLVGILTIQMSFDSGRIIHRVDNRNEQNSIVLSIMSFFSSFLC